MAEDAENQTDDASGDDVTPGDDSPDTTPNTDTADKNIPAPETARPSIEDLFKETVSEQDDDSGDDDASGDDADADASGDDADADADGDGDDTDSDTDADASGDGDDADADGEGTDADDDADADKGDDADADADADADKGDDDGGDTEQTPEQRDIARALDILRNPENLEAALREAGVEKAVEIPFIKDLLGRQSQSVRDQTANEINRAQSEMQAWQEATAEGNTKKQAIFEALNKAAEDIEAGEARVAIPTEEALEEAFEGYAQGKLNAYHGANWRKISDTVYGLPELNRVFEVAANEQGTYDEAQVAEARQAVNFLETLKGQDQALWMAGHFTVARDSLWAMAQEAARDVNSQDFENRQKLLVADHQKEIETLTAKHEKALKKAADEARAAGRADALAEFGGGKMPPKTPKGGKGKALEAEEVDVKQGATVEEIFKHESAKAASTPQV